MTSVILSRSLYLLTFTAREAFYLTGNRLLRIGKKMKLTSIPFGETPLRERPLKVKVSSIGLACGGKMGGREEVSCLLHPYYGD